MSLVFNYSLTHRKATLNLFRCIKPVTFLVNKEKKLITWLEGSPHQFGLYLRPNMNLQSILKSFSSSNKLFPLVLNQRW